MKFSAVNLKKMQINKKAISEIVSYVLLVVLAVGLATATYFWLLEQTNVIPEDICPEGVSITVENYTCYDHKIDLTLKNSGRFNVAGVRIKRINDTDTNFEYDLKTILNTANTPLNVTNIAKIEGIVYEGTLKKIRIYPYVLDNSGKSYICEKAVSEVIISEGKCPPTV